ncbi:MAG: hypothetical protein ICV79_27255 [Flavisolibacter sp.]|nr:hypothetical protein [Flavisolibacter sp.]
MEPEFVDVVGHISLKSLEKGDKKRHQKTQQHQSRVKQLSGGQKSIEPSIQIEPEQPAQPNTKAQKGNNKPHQKMAPQQQGSKSKPQQQKGSDKQQTAPAQKNERPQNGRQRPKKNNNDQPKS